MGKGNRVGVAKQQEPSEAPSGEVLLATRPLTPKWLLYTSFFIAFSLPNLVFSGRQWIDTLHIMKWFVTMVPVAVAVIVAGIRLFHYGPRRTRFRLDLFACIWLLLILYITMQPLLLGMGYIRSFSGFAKEWFFFATLFAVYLLAVNAKVDGGFHRALLWGSSVNAAINVLFAELTVRRLTSGIPFILDVPGYYIGNTAQQEMFGLWMAMAVLNCVYLHLSYTNDAPSQGSAYRRPAVLLNLLLLFVNAWGLWCSTARGAILSLLVGALMLTVGLWRSGEIKAVRRSGKLFAVVLLIVAAVMLASSSVAASRGFALVSKMRDMVMNPTSIGSRISIWTTSMAVYEKKPLLGVGLGQYKWHFLDGQRALYEKRPELLQNPEYGWQFTYWAHSEYIQWLCETGIIGSIILGLLALWWLWRVFLCLKRGEKIPLECCWGIAMLFLLWFDALFSRPFHRIENAVWMSLAFAAVNVTVLPKTSSLTRMDNEFVFRCFGGMMTGIALIGCFFLYGGIRGEKEMFAALTVNRSNYEAAYRNFVTAKRYLMSRDDASEQLAYFYVFAAQESDSAEIFSEGLVEMYKAFHRRPSSRLLFDLIKMGKMMGNKELLADLAVYLTPGMLGIAPDGSDISSQEATSQ